jgi:hypothetical protein
MSQEQDYYKIDAISNSKLSQVKAILYGGPLPQQASPDAFEFGRQFHEAVLEPEKYKLNLLLHKSYDEYKWTIREMVKSVKKNALLTKFLSDPDCKIELEHLFQEPRYLMPCKAKFDIKVRRVISDLKTTDCTTREEFEAKIIEYGYHRQGAFYMDGGEADRFYIFAVSKKYPHNTFTYCFNTNEQVIETGRTEIEYLIDEYLSLKSRGQQI